MAKGNRIVLSSEPQGRFIEGVLGNITPKPGTIMQFDISEALVGNRHVWEVYNADADGGNPKGPYIVLIEDYLAGVGPTTAYAANSRCFGYIPKSGDELNLLLADVAGTADDHTKGEILIVDDGTGKLIATTGTPEDEVAMLLEDVTDPTADTLAWCIWQGK